MTTKVDAGNPTNDNNNDDDDDLTSINALNKCQHPSLVPLWDRLKFTSCYFRNKWTASIRKYGHTPKQ
ncbi:hypothetical protein KM043_007424 [Ampulex compressa]|nr:hypothetical protein KM043_007424 [Ampulex compressa]